MAKRILNDFLLNHQYNGLFVINIRRNFNKNSNITFNDETTQIKTPNNTNNSNNSGDTVDSKTTNNKNVKSTIPKSSNELRMQQQVKKSTELSEMRQRATHLNWFFDPSIDKAANQPLIKLNPMTMMYSGVSDDDSHLLTSSTYLRRELPIRLAHLIKEFRNLPFIVACNPSVLEVHERYIKAFRNFEKFQLEVIKDFSVEEKFTDVVRDTMTMNKDILAMLAEGFRDSRRYIKNEQDIERYLNRILIARLATRLLCEHHIELHKQARKHDLQSQELNTNNADAAAEVGSQLSSSSSSSSGSSPNDKTTSSGKKGPEWVGIVNKNFSPKKLIESSAKLVTKLCMNKYGISPKIKIDGHIGATFPYIQLPLEYILPELLKNAFRATVEHNCLTNNPLLPDVSVTIGINEKDFIIRIRDRGGGIPHPVVPRIFDYHFTTAKENSQESDANDKNNNIDGLNVVFNSTTHGLSVMHGYGFGLPTSKAYADYLGGSIQFQTLQGIGTDFYLRLALFENESSIVRI